jgi:hypothetical protein
MNNIAESVFENKAVNSAINTINTTAANVVNSAGVGSGAIWFVLGAIVLVIVAVYFLYRPASGARGDSELPTPPPNPPGDGGAAGAGFGENWCFVGEDLTGRWCVKVPNSSACSPERLFSSRPGCELVEASASPAGINKNGGATMTPLFAAHTK